jgi:hypothetical protein
MEGDVLVLVQPFLHVRSCVGGQVVQYDVNGFSGMRLDCSLQEVKKIFPVPCLLALAEDFPGGSYSAVAAHLGGTFRATASA